MSSAGRVKIRLEPLGKTFEAERGTSLRDVLFPYGVEFPCGGRSRCRRCRVKVLEGALTGAPDEEQILGPEELVEGWRLACRCLVDEDVTLEIGQWETAILADDSEFTFTPRSGLGIAVDLGTTTLVAQLLDLETGRVLGVRTALNPQVVHGSDVMGRVEVALTESGLEMMCRLIRDAVGALVGELEAGTEATDGVREVVIVGNTVMHHLFCGVDPEPLSHYPFQPVDDGLKMYRALGLGWEIDSAPVVQFLPCLGGFVGSDILAGILASELDQSDSVSALLDLGTNGEIVLGSRDGILYASTAAGPAFEGGRISMGMRAATGAITEASLVEGRLRFHVLGNVAPRGVCGSGLVDIVAAGLETDRIEPSGRFTSGLKVWPLKGPVSLEQRDIRELQLAKAAIAAGLRILLRQRNTAPAELATLYLAGAFGNYVNYASARRIGLLDLPPERITPAGNTALLGAKLVLFRTTPEEREFSNLRKLVKHVPLAADPEFQDAYVGSMGFPGPD